MHKEEIQVSPDGEGRNGTLTREIISDRRCDKSFLFIQTLKWVEDTPLLRCREHEQVVFIQAAGEGQNLISIHFKKKRSIIVVKILNFRILHHLEPKPAPFISDISAFTGLPIAELQLHFQVSWLHQRPLRVASTQIELHSPLHS